MLCHFKMEYRHSPSYAIFIKVKKWLFETHAEFFLVGKKEH
jgi:hypothetical protein